MIAKIIYIIGIILCIKAVLEILKMDIGFAGKLISIVILLVTSWVGLLVYYLFAKERLTKWFK